MANLVVMIPVVILAAVSVAFLWGGIMAMRARRWWAPVLMTGGAGLQVVGEVLTCGGAVWMMMRMSSVMSSAGSGSVSTASSAVSAAIIMPLAGVLVMGLGFLLFTAGFVAFCGRYGSLERRAHELEGLVEGLQQRIE